MTSNFRIGIPNIPLNSTITATGDYSASDLKKLRGGSTHDIIRTATESDNDNYINFDLGSGNTKSAEFLCIKGANLLSEAGVYGVVLRGSTQSALLPASYNDLKIWWDPTRTITKDASALVSEMSGLADATLDATASGTARPTWTAPASTMNYNSWLEFDGSTDGMDCDGFATEVDGDDQPNSVFMCYRRDNTTNKDILFSLTNAASSNLRHLINHETGNNSFTIERNDGSSGTFQQPGGTTWTAGVTRTFSQLFTGTTVSVYRDGTAIGTGLALNVGSCAFTRCRLGYQQRGAGAAQDFWDGRIGEVLAFAKDASSENSALNEYMVTKWVTTPPDVTQDLSADLVGDTYFSTFAATTAYRHWWLQLQSRVAASTVACNYPLGRVLMGSLFDLGRDPVFPARETLEFSNAGVRKPSRVIELEWVGITNAKLDDFRTEIERLKDVSPVVLYEETAQVLRDVSAIVAWIREVQITRVSHNNNNIRLRFEEAI